MQLATTLSRGWQRLGQHHNPVVTTLTRAAGKVRLYLGEESWDCPVCNYRGPFSTFKGREKAMCPICFTLERHRLQMLVMQRLREQHDFSKMSILHFAPEMELAKHFKQWFGSYKSADLDDPKVDRPGTDITKMPFPDETFDVIYASHVLEHVQFDKEALRRIHRVLTPNGFAVVPVPIFFGIRTQEYGRAISTETDHWRQPGTIDYFERHEEIFAKVQRYESRHFAPTHQLFTLEDRSHWPTHDMPLRLAVPGKKHSDIVPVCYKAVGKRESRGWEEIEVPETVSA